MSFTHRFAQIRKAHSAPNEMKWMLLGNKKKMKRRETEGNNGNRKKLKNFYLNTS